MEARPPSLALSNSIFGVDLCWQNLDAVAPKLMQMELSQHNLAVSHGQGAGHGLTHAWQEMHSTWVSGGQQAANVASLAGRRRFGLGPSTSEKGMIYEPTHPLMCCPESVAGRLRLGTRRFAALPLKLFLLHDRAVSLVAHANLALAKVVGRSCSRLA